MITIPKTLFTTTYRQALKEHINFLIDKTLLQPTDFSNHHLIHKSQYLTILYSLKLLLVENPFKQRTTIYTPTAAYSPATVEELKLYLDTLKNNLLKKPVSQDTNVATANAVLLYEINRIEITE